MSRDYEFDIWSDEVQDWVLNPALIDEYYQSVAYERAFWAYRDEIAAQSESGDEPYAAYERDVERRYRGK